jgi:YVTN family beta-propeller protein
VLEFRILGAFSVVADGREVVVGGRKQRALLALLLLHRGEPLSSDRLIDLLWGERPPPTATTALRGHISNLRKTLGPDVLVTQKAGYLLAVEQGGVDADRFQALVDEARQVLAVGETRRGRELLEQALSLWRGEPLADLAYEPFAQAEIGRLAEARLAAIEDRAEADLLLGRHRELIGELRSLVDQHSERERLLAQLMLALYRSGRQGEALDAYRDGRRRLRDELGLEPGPDLRALEQQILNHDPALSLAGAPTTTAPAGAVASRRFGRGRVLVAAGGVLLLVAALAAGLVELAGGSASVRAAANTVAVIDTRSDRVTGAVAVGARPGPITFAAGSLWVANEDDQTVSRVDPVRLAAVRTISLADPPTGIAAAGNGVWVATSNPTRTFVSLSRIDPQFSQIAGTLRVGNVVPDTAASLASDAGGLWVAPFAGELTDVDPRTGRIIGRLDPNASPTGIAVGNGAVWVSDNTADTVTRIDPTGLTTPIAVGHGSSGIAVGYGGVWVADTGDDAVVRIDPDTRAVTATIPVGEAPTGVAIGAGSIWVANSGDGTVTRVDPASGHVLARIEVGGSPQQVAIADGRAWVTVDQPTVISTGSSSGGMLRIIAGQDVDYMDPALAYNGLSVQLLYATCAKLLNYPDKPIPVGSQLVPEVAQSLPARSPDGRTYTFTIRSGFRFSPPSNEPVTAQTFKDTIERTLNPQMHSPTASEYSDIVGAGAYMAGRAAHISGITASGDTLTVRLTAPAPDLPARLANSWFCAVPSDTPIDPKGVRVIPMAGPYQIASYTPGQGIVLSRNPNYHGNRPHHLERIEVTVGIPNQRAIAQVQTGAADYFDGSVTAAQAATLAAQYGSGSPAARAGHQQYFTNPLTQVDFLALNTHRPLFANQRLRQAVNYEIDRAALSRLGDEYSPQPEHPTDNYLPPGLPGYTNTRTYQLTPDLAKARALAAGHTPATATLYTCNVTPCDQQAQIIKTDLAQIGIQLQVKTYPDQTLYTKTLKPGEPFDIVWVGWVPDYLDPKAMLGALLEDGIIIPTFNDPTWRTRLQAAARLAGPERYLAYATLDQQLVRDAAPLIAFGNLSSDDFFSPRTGCQTFGRYGIDLAALCLRRTSR